MGSIPWNALLFFTLYLQLIGMSDFSASMLVSLFFGAVALGNLLGGWVGDRAASRFPNTGRIAATQFSVFIGIPLSWLLVKVTHHNLHCLCMLLAAILIILSAPTCFNICVSPTWLQILCLTYCFVADSFPFCCAAAMLDTKALHHSWLQMGTVPIPALHQGVWAQRSHTYAYCSKPVIYMCLWWQRPNP